MSASTEHTHQATDCSVGFHLLAFFLVFAPLIRGGNRPLPLLILELGALALAAYAFWRPGFKHHLSRSQLGVLAALWAIPLLQLVPLPPALWASLPGREYYAQALTQLNGETPFTGLRAASLIPFATESAWLALLPPLLVFVVAVGLPTRQLQSLVVLFLGLATFQALLGLIQYGEGSDSLFQLGTGVQGATGTYPNTSYLAGFLEMALPIGLALLTASVGRSRHSTSRKGLRYRLAEWLSSYNNRAVIYGAATLAILLALIFTRSRAGVAMAMLGVLLSTLAFSYRLGGKNVYGLLGSWTALGLGSAIMIGLTPVLIKFTQDPLSDGRWSIFSGTLQAIGQFFPLGSGGSTFLEVFRRFHPPDFAPGLFVSHAHNDYLEWIMEGGLIAAVLLVVLLVFYARQWLGVWIRGTWSTFRFLQVGAGIALLLVILHSFVDFNLHIPANAVFFAFLAAVFFHRHDEEEKATPRRRVKKEPTKREIQLQPQTIPPQNVVNPFAD